MIYGSATLLLCCWRRGGFAALLRFGYLFFSKIYFRKYISGNIFLEIYFWKGPRARDN